MAVKRIDSTYVEGNTTQYAGVLQFQGLSTDTKPTLNANQSGSTFYCVDDKSYHTWHIDEWVVPTWYTPIHTETVQEKAIELGCGFQVQLVGSGLASEGTETYLFRTPSDKLITFNAGSLIAVDESVSKDAFLYVSIHEGATITDTGDYDNVVISNFNRWGGLSASFIAKHDPTISVVGTLLLTTITSSSLSTNSNITFQLKQGVDYTVTVYNPSAAACNYVFTGIIFQLPLNEP